MLSFGKTTRHICNRLNGVRSGLLCWNGTTIYAKDALGEKRHKFTTSVTSMSARNCYLNWCRFAMNAIRPRTMTPNQHKFFQDAYRNECEAREVLRMPTKDARREFLSMIEKKRGKEARQYLEAEIMKQWKEGKN